MPDYKSIYDEVIQREDNYNRAENSPGFLNCLAATRQLEMLGGRALDLGCGVGFVVDLLSSRPYSLDCWGADISSVAVERARERIANGTSLNADRIVQLTDQTLPFDENWFSLITCFDMLEHLDESDIEKTKSEIERVLRRGGILYASVSCRPSGYNDQFGDNLHRTVRGIDWWVETLQPDRAEFDRARNQLVLWKRYRKAANP